MPVVGERHRRKRNDQGNDEIAAHAARQAISEGEEREADQALRVKQLLMAQALHEQVAQQRRQPLVRMERQRRRLGEWKERALRDLAARPDDAADGGVQPEVVAALWHEAEQRDHDERQRDAYRDPGTHQPSPGLRPTPSSRGRLTSSGGTLFRPRRWRSTTSHTGSPLTPSRT